MPSLARKLLIFTTLEGLVLQAHGSPEHERTVVINFKSRKLSSWTKPEGHVSNDEARLEAHGIIGSINIASLSFLIAITRREQVAQIYGKPVFVVTDVALLPLSSQNEANEAILATRVSWLNEDGTSDSDHSDVEDDRHSVTATEVHSPFEDDNPSYRTRSSNTRIAQNVAQRTAPYGKFASEWFSKRLWGSTNSSAEAPHASPTHTRSVSEKRQPTTGAETAEEGPETNVRDPAHQDRKLGNSRTSSGSSALSFLPKILRSTKMILSSRSFYFSYDFDLTRRLSLLNGRSQAPSRDGLDALYFWNRRLGSSFLDAGYDTFITPIIQGFVGQRTFTVKAVDTSDKDHASEQDFLLTLISRRSTKRSGLRYLRRGIDDEGNCANSAETEQILSSPTWDKQTRIRSFVQVRGSIPLYFSQSPYSLKPVPTFHNSAAANKVAFKRHFADLRRRYSAIQIAMLVNMHGTEATIGEAYQRTYKELVEDRQLTDTAFEWFDFHAECRGMKFENVDRLVVKLKENILKWGETVIENEQVIQTQQGIIRTNCMDCLDRTNVAQSAFGQLVLQQDLKTEGYDIDLVHDESTNWFNTLWADNGDAISRQYASTAALKGDFTRTRKRNWQGAVNDLGLTLSRYYSNMVNDYFSQAVIDVLLGNVSWKIFEDFESTMMSADPGISVASAREAAIENCAKIVIQDESEELVHGWTMLCPAHENTLRTFPFEETVVLLTDAAMYCCKFDWNTEKVARFEKVDLKSISKIRYGAYITSTFTERQLDDGLNQGLVIMFTPGHGDLIRVNTRSLQNHVSPDSHAASLDGGTGILSWFTPVMARTETRTMALKVIADSAHDFTETESVHTAESPRDLAQRICEDIRRAIEGPTANASSSNLLEAGDIISAADAKRRTGYIEQLGHSIKRLVWA